MYMYICTVHIYCNYSNIIYPMIHTKRSFFFSKSITNDKTTDAISSLYFGSGRPVCRHDFIKPNFFFTKC